MLPSLRIATSAAGYNLALFLSLVGGALRAPVTSPAPFAGPAHCRRRRRRRRRWRRRLPARPDELLGVRQAVHVARMVTVPREHAPRSVPLLLPDVRQGLLLHRQPEEARGALLPDGDGRMSRPRCSRARADGRQQHRPRGVGGRRAHRAGPHRPLRRPSIGEGREPGATSRRNPGV